MLTIFEIFGVGEGSALNHGELGLFEWFSLDTGSFREAFLSLLENLTLFV